MVNNTLVVTGGTRGIGKEIVKNFLKKNFKVFYLYKSKPLKSNEFKKYQNSLFGFKVNLENPKDIYKFVNYIKKKTKKIDLLINNAGDVIKRTNFITSEDKLWVKCVNLNLLSPIILSKKLLPLLLKSQKPVIINVSSIASRSGGAPNSIHYGVAKAGLNGFTKGLSSLNRKLRVVGIAPSIIDTDFQKKHSTKRRIDKIIKETPLKRIGSTKDITNLVEFLASDKASYISGETIFITGGR